MALNTTLKTDDIYRSSKLQARVGHSDDHAADIAETLKCKGKVPRPKIMLIDDPDDAEHDGRHYVIDGFHTLDGYRKAGKTMVPVLVTKGTWQDARDAASAANAQHTALKRGPEDKRRAIQMVFEDHPEWSSKMVAKHCRVSPGLVESVRETMPAARDVKERVTADKKKRPVKKKAAAPPDETSSQPPAKKAVTTFDWKAFDQHFGWVVRSVDALESLTQDPKTAKSAREVLEEFAQIATQWRNLLTQKEK